MSRKHPSCWYALCCAMTLLCAAQATANELPWTRWTGTSNRPVSWGRTVRTPYHYRLGDELAQYDNVASIPDFTDFLAKLAAISKAQPDVVLGIGPYAATFGEGTGGARLFRELILRDAAKTWKLRVKDAALLLHRSLGASRHIYWQIGNEINALSSFVQLDDPAKKFSDRSDVSSIAPYVEWVLAPTAEALMETRAEMPVASARLSIMLGTIATASNPRNVQWLESLLNYRIEGKYAQSLKGKAVHEVVDVVGLHYLISHADRNWDTTLTDLYNHWVRSGKLSAIFHTEEVGKQYAERGLGGAVAMKVLGRYLYWSSREKVNPEQSRMLPWILWKEARGDNVDQVMNMTLDFLGDVPLDVTQGTIAGVESYRLITADSLKALNIVVNTKAKPMSLSRVPVASSEYSSTQCVMLAPYDIQTVRCVRDGDGSVLLGKPILLMSDYVLLVMESFRARNKAGDDAA